MDNQLVSILGGGAVAVLVIQGIIALVKVLNERKRIPGGQTRDDGLQQQGATCGLLSGQFISVVNQQTELLRQLVSLSAKMESAILETKNVTVDNSHKLDSLGRQVAVIADRSGQQIE
jgi:hypothetical protein